MERRELGIRVLYTINSNTQYILALPTRKHSISILSLAPSHPHPHPPIVYGRAALKSCLDEVFCSSPELIPDGKRDFSIYALDPLEACSAMHLSGPSSAHSQPGVAIGLGLMSWTLADPECDIAVTGTVVNDPVRGEAFETVFAFRETPYVPRPSLCAAPYRTTKATEPLSRRTLPPRSVSRAPKLPSSRSLPSRTTVISNHPVDLASHASSSTVASTSASEAAGPLVPNAETTSTIKSLVDMLAGADKNPEILATLASIDATANGQKPSTNLMLIEALSKLLYPALAAPELPSNTRQAVSATLTGAPLSRSSSSRQPSRATREGSDDEIVVLDKENINPSAFKRRRSEKDALFDPPSSSADPEPLSSVLAVNTNTARASTNRKRTLSDFMDERDRERERTRKRTTSQSGISRKPSLSKKSAGFNFVPAHAKSDSVAEPGPSRSRNAGHNVPASSPPRQMNRRPYVTPAWAITDTATQPRFKEGFGAKEEKNEDGKFSRKLSRKSTVDGLRRRKSKTSTSRDENVSEPTEQPRSNSRISGTLPAPAPSAPRPMPWLPSTDPVPNSDAIQPVVAHSSDSFFCPSSDRPSTPSSIPEPPSTPSRPRTYSAQDSAVDDLFGSPLFTPVGKRRSPVSGSRKKPLSLHKSPFFSPAKRYPVRHPVSPLRRKSHPLALADDADDDGASPSSSLPVASDSEDDAAPRSPPRPVEPHWSIDLPPSSPPPPSSPMLSPCRDELVQEEDLTARLPAPPTVSPRRRMAPHDADPFAFFAGTDPETESSSDATLALEGFESVFTSDGFLAAAPIVPQSGISSSTDLVDFFSEPTMVGTEGDALATDGSPEDFSFEQFWDSMKGLLDQSATEGWQQNPDETVDPSLLSRPVDVAVDVTVDTVRLAHDVQTLYSGCLL